MTQAEIQHRISLVSSTDVAVGRISQQSISLVCTRYRQKKVEKEQLFTRRDMMMMTGIRNQLAVTRFLKRSKIGTKFASHTLYTQSDVDRILEAFSPPLWERLVTRPSIYGLTTFMRQRLAESRNVSQRM